MPSPARPTIGHFTFVCCIVLAFFCGLQFFMWRNLRNAMTDQTQAANARIANLEHAIAKINHRLNTPRIVPVVVSGAE